MRCAIRRRCNPSSKKSFANIPTNGCGFTAAGRPARPARRRRTKPPARHREPRLLDRVEKPPSCLRSCKTAVSVSPPASRLARVHHFLHGRAHSEIEDGLAILIARPNVRPPRYQQSHTLPVAPLQGSKNHPHAYGPAKRRSQSVRPLHALRACTTSSTGVPTARSKTVWPFLLRAPTSAPRATSSLTPSQR